MSLAKHAYLSEYRHFTSPEAIDEHWTHEDQRKYDELEERKRIMLLDFYNAEPELYFWAKPWIFPMSDEEAETVKTDHMRMLAFAVHGNEVLQACKFSFFRRLFFSFRFFAGWQ